MATTRTDRFSGTPTTSSTTRVLTGSGMPIGLLLVITRGEGSVAVSTSTDRFTGTPTVVLS